MKRRGALAALIFALAMPASAGATHNSTHVLPAYGIGALKAEWQAGDGTTTDLNGVADLQLMGDAKLGLYRARFRRDRVLSENSYSEWRQLDQLTREAALRGVTLAPVLIDMPGEVYTPPKTSLARARFAAFAEAAARRYGPSGSFWLSCACPKRPMRVWEVWNEPNIAPFWDTPDPALYGYLLREVKARLRAVDPGARILFGGLAYPTTYSSTRHDPLEFLRQVIATVGAHRFDALAVHVYRADANANVNTLIANTVNALRTYGGTQLSGAPRHQLWLNEFGRPTALDNPSSVTDERANSERSQQAWLDAMVNGLLPHRTDWNLGPFMWYSMRDAQSPTASWLRQGLRRTNADDSDAGPKPAWDAYASRSSSAGLLNLPVPR
jgi:hypothetical protein